MDQTTPAAVAIVAIVVEHQDPPFPGFPLRHHRRLVLVIEIAVVLPDNLSGAFVDDEDRIEMAGADENIPRAEPLIATVEEPIWVQLVNRIEVGKESICSSERHSQTTRPRRSTSCK